MLRPRNGEWPVVIGTDAAAWSASAGVRGVPGAIGRFKVPSLRNAVLKRSFMHNGQFANIGQVLGCGAHLAALHRTPGFT